VSEHYNAVLADVLARDLGVGRAARVKGRDRNPIYEIDTVPDSLLTEFWSRTAGIEAAKDQLVAEYAARRGRQPSRRAVLKLRQQATLATRPGKQVRSLAELTSDWRPRACEILGGDPVVWALQATRGDGRTVLLRADDVRPDLIDDIGHSVVAAVGDKRSTWQYWNLHAEASRQTMG
jgi:hypothetical protein